MGRGKGSARKTPQAGDMQLLKFYNIWKPHAGACSELERNTEGREYNKNSHLVIIPPNCEGKAALDRGIFRLVVRILQGTACQQCFLTLVKSNGSKFLPIVYQRFLSKDFVQRNFALELTLNNCNQILEGGWDKHLSAVQLGRG